MNQRSETERGLAALTRPDRYIYHVTLTTGHWRRSWRCEVADDAMPVVAALLDAALADEEVPIPAVDDPPCTLTVTATGRCMVATVWGPDHAPLATVGVAEKSKCGPRLWRMLHHHATVPVVTQAAECPKEPWCAVVLEPGLGLYPQTAHWLGDFERCLAWAWLAHIDARKAT